MDYISLIAIVKSTCADMAFRYRQDKFELYSHCLSRCPGILSRIDHTLPVKAQVSFVKRSIRGYCLHWLRDYATLIRTPRGSEPFKVKELTPTTPIQHTQPVEYLPDWVQDILEMETELSKRFANAYYHRYYND